MSLPNVPAVVSARPAASVILLRDAPGGIQAWLLRRVQRMAFAAGMTVFPGGRVDERDGAPGLPWAGDDPGRSAARLAVPTATVRASMVAAVRETFEETGVLLTRPPYASSDDAEATRWLRGRRREVEAGQRAFADLLSELGLAVDAALIRPWARWITPAQEGRRYDTVFYVAALPIGADAQPGTTEAEQAQWLRPPDALAQYAAGHRPMLAPTVVTLGELAAFDRVEDVLAAANARSLDAVRPTVAVGPDGAQTVVLPDGRTFHRPTVL